MDRAEFEMLIGVLEKRVDGRTTNAEAESALQRLHRLPDMNISENVSRFRQAMKIRIIRPSEGTPEYWMHVAIAGMKQAYDRRFTSQC